MARKTYHMERGVRLETAIGVFEPRKMHVRAETELEAANLFGERMRALGFQCAHGWKVIEVIDPDQPSFEA